MSSVRFLPYPKFQAQDDNGNPLEGGKVFVYSAGTSNKITTWSDFNQTSKNTNPVILDSRGEADIFFDAPAKIQLKDENDVTVWTEDNIRPLNAQTLTGKFNLVENGSFELDGDGDGKPDSWDIVETTDTSTVEIDTSNVAHGTQSLKFSSGGGGGGTATTSEKFPIPDNDSIGVSFQFKSTTTTATSKVDIITYDSDGNNPSTTNIYTSGGTAPSTFTQKAFPFTASGGQTQAELKLTGVDNAVTATSYFDNVKVLDQGYIFTGAAGEVTADASELSKLDGFTGNTTELNAVLAPYSAQRVELGGDFDANEEVVCERIGNTVTITSVGRLGHTSGSAAASSSGVIPSQFRPSTSRVYNVNTVSSGTNIQRLDVDLNGDLRTTYFDSSLSLVSDDQAEGFTISFVITGNIS